MADVCLNPNSPGCLNKRFFDLTDQTEASGGTATASSSLDNVPEEEKASPITIILPENPTPLLATVAALAKQRREEKFAGAIKAFLKMVWVTGRELVDTNLKDLAKTYAFLPQDQGSRRKYLDDLYTQIKAASPDIDKYAKASLDLMDKGLVANLKDLQDQISEASYAYLNRALQEEFQKLEEMKPFKNIQQALSRMQTPLKGIQDKIQALKLRIEKLGSRLGGERPKELKDNFEVAVKEYDSGVKARLRQIQTFLEKETLTQADQAAAMKLIQELQEGAPKFEQRLRRLETKTAELEKLPPQKKRLAEESQKGAKTAALLRGSSFSAGVQVSGTSGPYIYPTAGGIHSPGADTFNFRLFFGGDLRLNNLADFLTVDVLGNFAWDEQSTDLDVGARFSAPILQNLRAYELFGYSLRDLSDAARPHFLQIGNPEHSLFVNRLGLAYKVSDALRLSAEWMTQRGAKYFYPGMGSTGVWRNLFRAAGALDVGRLKLNLDLAVGDERQSTDFNIGSSVNEQDLPASGDTLSRYSGLFQGALNLDVNIGGLLFVPRGFHVLGGMAGHSFFSKPGASVCGRGGVGYTRDNLDLMLEGLGGRGAEYLPLSATRYAGLEAGVDILRIFNKNTSYRVPLSFQWVRANSNIPGFNPAQADVFTLSISVTGKAPEPEFEESKELLERGERTRAAETARLRAARLKGIKQALQLVEDRSGILEGLLTRPLDQAGLGKKITDAIGELEGYKRQFDAVDDPLYDAGGFTEVSARRDQLKERVEKLIADLRRVKKEIKAKETKAEAMARAKALAKRVAEAGKRFEELKKKVRQEQKPDFPAILRNLSDWEAEIPAQEEVKALSDYLTPETKQQFESLRKELSYWKTAVRLYQEQTELEARFRGGEVTDLKGFSSRLGTLQQQVTQKLHGNEKAALDQKIKALKAFVQFNQYLMDKVLAAYLRNPDLQKGIKPGETLRIRVLLTQEGRFQVLSVAQKINNPALEAFTKKVVTNHPGLMLYSSGKQEATVVISFPAVSKQVVDKTKKLSARLETISGKVKQWEQVLARSKSGEGLKLAETLRELKKYEKEAQAILDSGVTGVGIEARRTLILIKRAKRDFQAVQTALNLLDGCINLRAREASAIDTSRGYELVLRDYDAIIAELTPVHADLDEALKNQNLPAWLKKELAVWRGRLEGKINRARESKVKLSLQEAGKIETSARTLETRVKVVFKVPPEGKTLSPAGVSAQREEIKTLKVAQEDLAKLTERAQKLFRGEPGSKADRKVSALEDNLEKLGNRLQQAVDQKEARLARAAEKGVSLKKLEQEAAQALETAQQTLRQLAEQEQQIRKMNFGTKQWGALKKLRKRVRDFKSGAVQDVLEKEQRLEKSQPARGISAGIVVFTGKVDALLEGINAQITTYEENHALLKPDLKIKRVSESPRGYDYFLNFYAEQINAIFSVYALLNEDFARDIKKLKGGVRIVFDLSIDRATGEIKLVFNKSRTNIDGKKYAELIGYYERVLKFINTNYPEALEEMVERQAHGGSRIYKTTAVFRFAFQRAIAGGGDFRMEQVMPSFITGEVMVADIRPQKDRPLTSIKKGLTPRVNSLLKRNKRKGLAVEGNLNISLAFNYLGRPLFPKKQGSVVVYIKQGDSYLAAYVARWDDKAAGVKKGQLYYEKVGQLPDRQKESVILIDLSNLDDRFVRKTIGFFEYLGRNYFQDYKGRVLPGQDIPVGTSYF